MRGSSHRKINSTAFQHHCKKRSRGKADIWLVTPVWMDQTGDDATLEDLVLCILILGACREACGKEQHGEKEIQLENKKTSIRDYVKIWGS